MNNTIRIGLLNESPNDLLTVKKTIENALQYQLIFEAWNWDDLKDKMKQQSVDLLILNLQLTFLHGTKAIDDLKAQLPNMKLIIFTLYDQPKILYHYLEQGINGIILKHFDSKQIYQTIDGVLEYGSFFVASILKSMTVFQNKKAQREPINFSRTELKIIKGICNELTSDSMSKKFFLSKRTVDWHRNEIKLKIGASSTIGIVKYAIVAGIFIL
jgi:two-component system nitrate/nitrite response regulator NarL